MAHLGNSSFVVAIDFGTTYSGYAFTSKLDIQNDPPKFSTSNWQGDKLISMKAPTAVLLNNDQELVVFGYEAENRYSEIVEDGEQDEYCYFYRFKSMLYNKGVTRTTEIKDATGKSMPSIKVFSVAIEFLMNEVVKKIKEVLKSWKDGAFYYVLTVSALWDHCTKEFMIEAAKMAGIRREKLDVVLEPEAALIFCQRLRTNRVEEQNGFNKTVKAGLKYMVIDLGEETAITVLQRKPDGTIETAVPPCSGPWGGKSVDEAFSTFLANICGTEVMANLKENEPEDYIDLFREFEMKKRSIKTDQTSKIVITLPVSLTDLVKKKHKKFENAVENSRYKERVHYSKQKLHISPDVFRDLFNNTIKEIIKLVESLLKEPKLSNTNTILMVGGFSESDLVQDAVRKAIGEPRKLIIPEEAGLAVVQGAVLFGHQPKVVGPRVAIYTYGGQGWADWDPDMHPETKKVTINGQFKCKDIFFKYVTKGERIQRGHEVSRIYQVRKPEEGIIESTIYISSDENPRYITDPSCQRLGTLVIQIPPHSPEQTIEIEETLIFGDTELLCRSRNLRTGRISEVQFDFL